MGNSSSTQRVALESHQRLETKDLPSVRLLGKGLSGFVYETTWKGKKYARKDFPVGSRRLDFFAKEVSVLLKLEHPNIVKCIGYSVGKSSCSLLLEYVNSDLQNDIQRKIEAQTKTTSTGASSTLRDIDEIKRLLSEKVRTGEITGVDGGSPSVAGNGIPLPLYVDDETLGLISQIATGMKYLHDNGVVHGDLKPKNVLICSESGTKIVKVGDFGLFEIKKRIKLVSKRKRHFEILTWKAPELFSKLLGPLTEDSDDPFTDSDTDLDEEIGTSDNFLETELAMADVYSFGLTCVYILGGQLFFPGLSLTQLRKQRSVDFRPELPPTCPGGLRDLIYSSLKCSPRSRPTFSAICTQKALLPALEEGKEEGLMPVKTLSRLKQLITSEGGSSSKLTPPDPMRPPGSGLAAGDGTSSSKSTPPKDIEKVSDAVYKFCDPTVPLEVEIVFIHGLQYSQCEEAYWKTWIGGEKGNETCWPKTWLSEELPGARIWSLSYDPCAFRPSATTGKMDVYVLGDSLVQQIVELAKIGQANRPIVFVCYCLGGLVVKEIVIEAHGRFRMDRKYVNFLRNVRGFFFYATPHDGSLLADLASHLPFGRSKSKLVENLRVVNDSLGRLNAEFESIERDHFAGKWEFSVVAETCQTTMHGFSAMVVQEVSARHGYADALTVAADHFGVCTPDTRASASFQSVRHFVEDVLGKDLGRLNPFGVLPDLLVGMEDRLQEVRRILDRHSSVGLVGMGGIGKTTLSRLFYQLEGMKFENSCFLGDVDSRGIKAAQEQLFRDLCGDLGGSGITSDHVKQVRECILTKMVLVVVDDVRNEEDLKSLLGDVFKDGRAGSKVIVTTRDQGMLHGFMDFGEIFSLELLNSEHSLELFSFYAYDQLGEREKVELHWVMEAIIDACNGLPLIIEVMGCFLREYGQPLYADDQKDLWKEALEKLRKANSLDGSANDRLWASLRISYDALDEDHKSMFLDFACIFSATLFVKDTIPFKKSTFKGISENLGRIWGDMSGVHSLMQRSLIKWDFDKNVLIMQSQLRDMGRSIANRSRICNNDEGLKFLLKNKSSKTLEGLLLYDVSDYDLQKSSNMSEMTNVGDVEVFENLRLLNIQWSPLPVVEYYLSLCSKELKWLCLHETKIKSANVKELGSFQYLRVLEMKFCRKLKLLPESIGKLVNLQELDLQGCSSLISIPEYIGNLVNLLKLSLEGCSALMSLPYGIGNLSRLQELDLQGCSSLTSIPENIGHFLSLRKLSLRGCYALMGLPESIGHLLSLQELDLQGCSSLTSIPDNIGNLVNLHELSFERCSALMYLPGSSGNLVSLRKLSLRGCSALMCLPESICNLRRLQELDLQGCSSLTSIPDNIGNLVNLREFSLVGCSALMYLPERSGNLVSLRKLSLKGCSALVCLPESIGNLRRLQELNLQGCSSLISIPEYVVSLVNLVKLSLGGCSSLKSMPHDIGNLVNLLELSLWGCSALMTLPESISRLVNLLKLSLGGCFSLMYLPESIGNLVSLRKLSLRGCYALMGLPESIGKLRRLHELDLEGCSSVIILPDSIGGLQSLEMLLLEGCEALESLPKATWGLTSLKILDVGMCYSLKEIYGGSLKLEYLNVQGCSNLETLHIDGSPFLTTIHVDGCSTMTELSLNGCSGLVDLPQEIGDLVGLRSLRFDGCSSLKRLPSDIGDLRNLRTLILQGCSSLKELPQEIGQLAVLTTLSLVGCSSLEDLSPNIGQLAGLTTLSLVGCPSLKQLPTEIGELTALTSFSLVDCSSIQQLPHTIAKLTALTSLRLDGCSWLQHIPHGMGNLRALITISLDGCNSLENLPHGVLCNVALTTLSLVGCSRLKHIPQEIGNLSGLTILSLGGCSSLEELPCEIGLLRALTSLSLDGCSSLRQLPSEIGKLRALATFSLKRCSRLEELPSEIGEMISLTTLSLVGCSSLKELPGGICNLSDLNTLTVDGCSNLKELPSGIGNLRALTRFSLVGCSRLVHLPGEIDELGTLESLKLDGLRLKELPCEIRNLTALRTLSLDGCSRLEQLPLEIGELTALKTLSLDGCVRLKELPQTIGNLAALTTLSLDRCSNLKQLPIEICDLTSLTYLSLNHCASLEELPTEIGNLMALTTLSLEDCSMLKELPASIQKLQSLKTLSSEGWSKLVNPAREENLHPDAIPNSRSPSSDSTISNATVLDSTIRKSAVPSSMGSSSTVSQAVLQAGFAESWRRAGLSSVLSRLLEVQRDIFFYTKMETLNLDGSMWLEQLPRAIVTMIALRTLSLVGCSNLQFLPEELANLKALKTLRLDGCSRLVTLPHKIRTAIFKGTLNVTGFSSISNIAGAGLDQVIGNIGLPRTCL